MKKSNILLIIGYVMIIAAIVFIIFAFNHPEMSFVGGNIIAYAFYTIYVILIVTIFITAKKRKN